MSYLKCTKCRIRAHASSGAAVAEAETVCPGCGGPLEPAATTVELIGFRMADLPVAEDAWDVALSAALTPRTGR